MTAHGGDGPGVCGAPEANVAPPGDGLVWTGQRPDDLQLCVPEPRAGELTDLADRLHALAQSRHEQGCQ